jgi:tetratricopeptide (TPR) repeat protein
MHQRALSLAVEAEGPHGPTVASTYRALALFYEAIGQPDTALQYFDNGLHILRQQVGDSHPAFASCLSQKGLLLISVKRYGDASSTLEQAVTISEKALGPDHPDVGFKLGNLGIALHELGRLDEAIIAHERSLAILRSRLRGQDRSVAIQLANLAATHRAKGDLDKAGPLLAEALMPVPIPPIDDFLIGTSENLVVLSQDRNAIDDARPVLERLTTAFDVLKREGRVSAYTWLAGLWREVGDTQRSQGCLQLAAPSPRSESGGG